MTLNTGRFENSFEIVHTAQSNSYLLVRNYTLAEKVHEQIGQSNIRSC